MIFDKILKIDDTTFTFKVQDTKEYHNLKEAIPDFFENQVSGIHIAIVCIDSDNCISAKKFCELLKKKDRTVAVIEDSADVSNYNCLCNIISVTNVFEIYTGILSCMSVVHEKGKINTNMMSFLEKICPMLGIFTDPETLKNVFFSEEAAKNMTEQAMNYNPGESDIRIIIFLKEDSFVFFEQNKAFFPCFIQYVIHGISEALALQKKNKEIEEYKYVIQEKDSIIQSLKEKNKILEDWNHSLEKKNTELEKEINIRQQFANNNETKYSPGKNSVHIENDYSDEGKNEKDIIEAGSEISEKTGVEKEPANPKEIARHRSRFSDSIKKSNIAPELRLNIEEEKESR